MGQKPDIDTIHCYIDLSHDENNTLFNREQIHRRFSRDVSSCLEKYGLEYKIEPLAALGAGRVETLWEILKFAWDNKGLIGIILSSIKIVFNIPKNINSVLKKIVSQQRPKAQINLGLETTRNYTDKDLGFQMGRRLINLKRLNDEICKSLASKYPTFGLDQSFSLFIQPRHFSVSYCLNYEQRNVFNSFRLMRFFKNLRIKNNSYSVYTFTKWLFISRFDGKLEAEGRGRIKTPNKQYYLLFSTNIISDYFKSK